MAIGLALLYCGAEGLVRGGSRFALRLGIAPLVVGLTVVAYGTSTPELAVSLKATLQDRGGIAVGNALGSNIANLALVLGMCALVRPVAASSQVLRREIPILIAVTALAVTLLADGRLGRGDGVVLLGVLIAYTGYAAQVARQRSDDVLAQEFSAELKVTGGAVALDLAWMAAGLLLLILGGKFFVDGAVDLARRFGWGETLIGLTIVAVGTSLPELATSLLAAFRGEDDILVGNLVGSSLFNLAGILGMTGSLRAVGIAEVTATDLGVIMVVTLALAPFLATGRRVSRREGAVLVTSYLLYLGHLVRQAG